MPARKPETVLGHTIAPPRITLGAIALLFLYVGVPILAIGGTLDLLMQLLFGVCTGVWCFVK